MCTSALTNPCFKSYTNSKFTHSCRQPFNVVCLHYHCLVSCAMACGCLCIPVKMYRQPAILLPSVSCNTYWTFLSVLWKARRPAICCLLLLLFCLLIQNILTGLLVRIIPVRGRLQLWTLFFSNVSTCGNFGCYYSSRGKLAHPHPDFLEC